MWQFLGGIGLFLLGMREMTDGLRLAAGSALREVLIAATASRLRAVASGILITAMVQSSSAVIFITIGFVNAGLLSLGASVGIIFGSNLGTTLTSWIVALIGVNVKVQAFALPMIGAGTLAWVVGGKRRWAALGRALAGLGLFFLGLEILKGAFVDLAFADAGLLYPDDGWLSLLLALLVGALLTILMQSSSAALAVVLTATATGLLPLQGAAAMVIGANIGTTSTAVFAIIGATPAAKRAALAHVVFNLVTGAATLLLTLPLLAMIDALLTRVGAEQQLATHLALFHTASNLIGLLLLWPLTTRLVAWLERRFASQGRAAKLPLFLDRHIQMTPTLALDALSRELEAMSCRCRRLALEALEGDGLPQHYFDTAAATEARLNTQLADYAAGIYHQEHDGLLSGAVPAALRAAQYSVFVAESASRWRAEPDSSRHHQEAWAQSMQDLTLQAINGLQQLDQSATLDVFEQDYAKVKQHLLTAASRSQLSANHLAQALERLSELHRMMQDAGKAASDLLAFDRMRLEKANVAAPVGIPKSDQM
jgi:phosphate:Na+ symporter